MSADLLYSETEQDLRASVRRLLSERAGAETVVTAYDDVSADFTGLWKSLASELGLAGLLVPEELGGAGASTREAAVVMEEIGRAVAPVPFFTSAVLATSALLKAGETEVLGQLAAGDSTAALIVPLSTAPGTFTPTVKATASGLVGSVTTVAGVAESDVLVVPVAGESGLELHTVRIADATVTPVLSLDMTRRLADVEFSGSSSVRVDSGNAAQAVEEALLCGSALLASEQFAVAQWCLETTLAYVKERKQFGRAIGSYQAIKHRLADLWLEVSSSGAASTICGGHLCTRRRRCGDRSDGGPGILQRRRGSCCGGVRPTSWWYRNDVGISGAPVPQTGEERSAVAGNRVSASGTPRRVGRPPDLVLKLTHYLSGELL